MRKKSPRCRPLILCAFVSGMFLKEDRVEALLPQVLKNPWASKAHQAFLETWEACGLPPQTLSQVVGGVYCDGPPEPLLEEPERQRATDPSLWQLVYIPPVFDATGMEIMCFDSLEEAQTKLNSLKLGEIDEGGGIIFKNKEPVAEKLVLKYMEKEDFLGFLEEATKTPEKFEPTETDEIKAIEESLLDRLNELSKLAPDIGKLKVEYEAIEEKPKIVYGKPSMSLVELSRLFPDLVTLGGCAKPKPAP